MANIALAVQPGVFATGGVETSAVKYQFYTKAGAAIGSATATGVFELSSTGCYGVADPSFGGTEAFVVWTDTRDATAFAIEVLDFRMPNVGTGVAGAVLTAGTGTAQLSVASGIASANVTQLLGTAWLTPGTAGTPDVNAKLLGGTAQTGRDIGLSVLLSTGTGTGQLDFTSGVVKANATQWLGGTIPTANVTGVPLVDAKYLLGTVFPTPTVAGIPNVNVKTINDVATTPVTTIKAVQGLAVDGVITTLTNLPAITAGWLTAAGIAAGALNGKGDWLLASSYTAPSNLTAAQIATGVWQDTTAGDFTVAISIGKSIMNGVALGTGLTVASVSGAVGSVTGNVYGNVQGDVFGEVGSISNITFPTNFDALLINGLGYIGRVILVDTTTANTDMRGTNNAALAATALSTTQWTNARAGYLDALNTGVPLAASQHVIVDSGTVTTLTNLPAITTDWLTAAGVKADAVTKIQDGLSTYAGGDTSGTTTLLGRITSARAGYLDNLNVGGPVASQADVQAINQSSSKHLLIQTVAQYERPESGTTSYTVEVRTFSAATGAAVNADSTPTVSPLGAVSGDLSANLGSASHPASGVYRYTYTVSSGDTQEQIRFDASATIASSTFTLSCFTQVVDVVSATWSTADSSHLAAIFNKLPANDIADETLLLAAIGDPAQAGDVTLAAVQPNYAPAKAGDDMNAASIGGSDQSSGVDVPAFLSSLVQTAGKLWVLDGAGNALPTLDGIATRLTSEHGAGPWGLPPGDGANAITITVTDGSSALEGVLVRIYDGVTVLDGITDVDGHADFNLDAKTWTVGLFLPGHSFPPSSRTVTGQHTGTLESQDLVMGVNASAVAPSDPDKCLVFGWFRDASGAPASNVKGTISLEYNGMAVAGAVIVRKSFQLATNAVGYFEQVVYRTDAITPDNLEYRIVIPASNLDVLTSVEAGTLDVSGL